MSGFSVAGGNDLSAILRHLEHDILPEERVVIDR